MVIAHFFSCHIKPPLFYIPLGIFRTHYSV
nr:MAG TPA: pinin/SDK/memA/ protein conserved region [Caudoviricetes sp.]